MPRQRQYYGLNHLHFITASTYRRARLFDSDRFRRQFIATLDVLRRELEFKVAGYVLMPEHLHLLLWPSPHANPSQIVPRLKARTAKFTLSNLAAHPEHPWCAKMLSAPTLPTSVHLHGPHRVWPRRFYDLNIWSKRKLREKLDYMPNNPVKRRRVASPDQWPWSSFRFIFLQDASVLPMEQLP